MSETWHVDAKEPTVVRDAKGWLVCAVPNAANARKIAATPEMVAALIGVLRAQGDGALPEWCGPVVEALCKAGVSI